MNDQTSKKLELLDLLRRYLPLNVATEDGGVTANPEMDELIDHIEFLYSRHLSREWVRVEDRLPETGVEILATTGRARFVCYYHDNCHYPWCHVGSVDPIMLLDGERITHWMPLLQNPKE